MQSISRLQIDVQQGLKLKGQLVGPGLYYAQFLPIMLLSNAQKVTH